MRTIDQLNEHFNLKDKQVLVRADLNVPLDENLNISDDNRIKEFLPTLKKLLGLGAKVIVMSHFGEPESKADSKYSLKPVAQKISQLLGQEIQFSKDCVGPEVEAQAKALISGRVLLLENTRFHPGEKKNDPEFSAMLARLGQVYINDAFATAHRAHASVVGVAKHFKEKAAGLLMQKEIEYYNKALLHPTAPLCVVLGGAKVSSKLKVLMNLAKKADKLLIGGAMANTFLAAQGYQTGRSLVERDLFPKVVELLAMLVRRDCKLYLPVDFRIGSSPKAKGEVKAVTAQEIPADSMALDIGPATSLLYQEALQNAGTIVWNGPMGAYENEDYSTGTTDMVGAIASTTALKVVGGGDTDSAIHAMELNHKFDFISTGGGAFLALLEGESLPALKALE